MPDAPFSKIDPLKGRLAAGDPRAPRDHISVGGLKLPVDLAEMLIEDVAHQAAVIRKRNGEPVALAGTANNRNSTPAVVCSQASLARFEGRAEHTTGLAQKLKDEGILREFTPPKRKGGKYHFWFADLERHKKALEAISKKPGRRAR